MHKIKRILIANRGEIALRIMKTARKMAIETVAVFSTADRKMPFVRYADYAVNIGNPAPHESYLNIEKIVEAALRLKCEAIHPGYGFLSENYLFAEECEKQGLIFIGPSPSAIEQMGDKLRAKSAVKKFNIPLVPGTETPVDDVREAEKISEIIGFPVMIKASAGGGGKGMRIVKTKAQLKDELNVAMGEAKSAFGDASVFIEKFIENPRHIEVQIMADKHGNIVHLNERECSIQRRHQKVIEESPSPIVDEELRQQLGKAAIDVGRACDYVGAGTVEFIMDETKKFYFLEMNTRLQVEHPVTEFITGLDLVKMQIEIAEGKAMEISQEDVKINGHAIELRVTAEDPEENFSPSIGLITNYMLPHGQGVRVDNGYEAGVEVPVFYDPLIAKLIVHGVDRNEAIEKMSDAIDSYKVGGVKTTLPFGKFVMQNSHFIEGNFDTNFISRYFEKEKQEEDAVLEKIVAVVANEFFAEYHDNLLVVGQTKTNWRSRLKNK